MTNNTRVLQGIVSKNTMILAQDHINAIQEWFEYLNTFPLDIGYQLLSSFVTLTNFSQRFKNFLFMMFRKSLPKRSNHHRSLSIHGICLLLKRCTDIQSDIVTSLKPAFSYSDHDVVTHLLTSISNALQDINLSSSAAKALFELLRVRVSKFLGKDGVNMDACYEHIQDDIYMVKDDIARLLKCLFDLGKCASPEKKWVQWIKRTFELVVEQLSSVEQVCAMLSESSTNLVKMHILFPIYEVLIVSYDLLALTVCRKNYPVRKTHRRDCF